MTRGKVAAGMAAAGVVLAALAVVQGAVFAASGAYLLLVGPLVGLPIALAVYRALRRRCTSGSGRAYATALGGSLLLGAIAIIGISFGGFPLLLPALLLAVAAMLTPASPGADSCQRS